MIAVSFTLALLGVGIVVLPFLKTSDTSDLMDYAVHPVKALEAEKETLLQSMRELDFDFQTEKISKSDYQTLRRTLEDQTIKTFKAIEKAQTRWDKMEASL